MKKHLFVWLFSVSILLFMHPVFSAPIASGSARPAPKPWEPMDGVTFLHLRGSSTFLTTVQNMAEEFMIDHPGAIIVVAAGGTSRGVKAIIDGTAEIGVTSSILTDEQLKTAGERKVKLYETVIARGAVVPIVHPSNPIKDISIEQLKHIYIGTFNNWKQVDGPNMPIKVVSHEFTRGSFETWRRCVLGKNVIISSQSISLEPPGPVKNYISDHPEAIGYINFTDVDPSVKALSVNGIVATFSTISNATFPIRRDHAFVTRENVSELARKFLSFALDPNRGQKIVEKFHLAPNKKPAPKESKVKEDQKGRKRTKKTDPAEDTGTATSPVNTGEASSSESSKIPPGNSTELASSPALPTEMTMEVTPAQDSKPEIEKNDENIHE